MDAERDAIPPETASAAVRMPTWAAALLGTVLLNLGVGLVAWGRLTQRVDEQDRRQAQAELSLANLAAKHEHDREALADRLERNDTQITQIASELNSWEQLVKLSPCHRIVTP